MKRGRSSKIRKYGRKSKLIDAEEKDRISTLPDEVLCHILSFLPTKYAVATSLLSTRWKSVWTSFPSYDFSSDSPGPEESSGFMDFVDRALLLHPLPNVNRFHLLCHYGYYDPSRVRSWICTAIKRNVQELVLHLSMEPAVKLPPNLFTSTNLVILKLTGDILFPSRMRVFLPSLKVLNVRSLKSIHEDSFKILLSGCPFLEELDIKMHKSDCIKTLCICSLTLKKLCVRYGWIERGNGIGNEIKAPTIEIKAPALEILDLCDFVSHGFDVDELPSIVKADIRVPFPDAHHKRKNDYLDSVAGMLGKISTVQHLRIFYETIKVVIKSSAYNQLFCKDLTHLHIDCYDMQWSMIQGLLELMPNVKRLAFDKAFEECDSCLWHVGPDIVPSCLSFSVETIAFSGFAGCKAEMKLVRYLLENAMVLKKITLESFTRNDKVKTQILKLPRGSSACEIKLLYWDFSKGYKSVVEWI